MEEVVEESLRVLMEVPHGLPKHIHMGFLYIMYIFLMQIQAGHVEAFLAVTV